MKIHTNSIFIAFLLCSTILLLVCGGSQKGGPVETVTLRSESAELTADDIMQVVNEKGFHCPGENLKGSFQNSFEQATFMDAPVVIDHATGLMWQQSVSEERLDWREAEAYVQQANETELAGFTDWRIPTVEELLSLMAQKAKNEYFIDPSFQNDLLSTWSIDTIPEAFAGAWFVDFTEGKAADGNRAAGLGHVRLVRTASQPE